MRTWTVGIDPGTNCGWAVISDLGAVEACGTWDLKPRRQEGGGMRFVRVRNLLGELLGTYGTHGGELLVFFEEVRRHQGVDAAHVYGGIVAVITSVCEERKIPYQGVPVATIKRKATGKGGGKAAGKEQMLAAARSMVNGRGIEVSDDNAADAIFCGLAGRETVGL